jgi:glycosyltransferase involved in cell wall biosynthesis
LGDCAKAMSISAPICITVLAHNEAARIAVCLNSLPLSDAGVAIHVVVNGSSDATANIARAIAAKTSNLSVHEYAEGGKARSWNRFLFDELSDFHGTHVFVDGDAEVVPGSVAAMAAMLHDIPAANAISAMPNNGRKMHYYREAMRRRHGLFGDLYALRGSFLARMKGKGIRLPDDLVGDDGLIGALAKTDLGDERDWRDSRVVTCEAAGFLCEPVSLLNPVSWRMQYRRMISYSTRHFQNRLVSNIMRSTGPSGLPRQMASLYADNLPVLMPRAEFPAYWFDRIALRRMREHI